MFQKTPDVLVAAIEDVVDPVAFATKQHPVVKAYTKLKEHTSEVGEAESLRAPILFPRRFKSRDRLDQSAGSRS